MQYQQCFEFSKPQKSQFVLIQNPNEFKQLCFQGKMHFCQKKIVNNLSNTQYEEKLFQIIHSKGELIKVFIEVLEQVTSQNQFSEKIRQMTLNKNHFEDKNNVDDLIQYFEIKQKELTQKQLYPFLAFLQLLHISALIQKQNYQSALVNLQIGLKALSQFIENLKDNNSPAQLQFLNMLWPLFQQQCVYLNLTEDTNAIFDQLLSLIERLDDQNKIYLQFTEAAILSYKSVILLREQKEEQKSIEYAKRSNAIIRKINNNEDQSSLLTEMKNNNVQLIQYYIGNNKDSEDEIIALFKENERNIEKIFKIANRDLDSSFELAGSLASHFSLKSKFLMENIQIQNKYSLTETLSMLDKVLEEIKSNKDFRIHYEGQYQHLLKQRNKFKKRVKWIEFISKLIERISKIFKIK